MTYLFVRAMSCSFLGRTPYEIGLLAGETTWCGPPSPEAPKPCAASEHHEQPRDGQSRPRVCGRRGGRSAPLRPDRVDRRHKRPARQPLAHRRRPRLRHRGSDRSRTLGLAREREREVRSPPFRRRLHLLPRHPGGVEQRVDLQHRPGRDLGRGGVRPAHPPRLPVRRPADEGRSEDRRSLRRGPCPPVRADRVPGHELSGPRPVRVLHGRLPGQCLHAPRPRTRVHRFGRVPASRRAHCRPLPARGDGSGAPRSSGDAAHAACAHTRASHCRGPTRPARRVRPDQTRGSRRLCARPRSAGFTCSASRRSRSLSSSASYSARSSRRRPSSTSRPGCESIPMPRSFAACSPR